MADDPLYEMEIEEKKARQLAEAQHNKWRQAWMWTCVCKDPNVNPATVHVPLEEFQH